MFIFLVCCTVIFYFCLALLQALLCSNKLKNVTHIFQLGFLSHLIAFISFNGDNMKKKKVQRNSPKYPIIDFQLYFLDVTVKWVEYRFCHCLALAGSSTCHMTESLSSDVKWRGWARLGIPRWFQKTRKLLRCYNLWWQVKVQFRKFCVEKKVIIFSFPSLLGAWNVIPCTVTLQREWYNFF